MVGARKETRLLIARQQKRWQQRRLLGALRAWQVHAQRKAAAAVRLRGFVERRAAAASSNAFLAWQQYVADSRRLQERAAKVCAMPSCEFKLLIRMCFTTPHAPSIVGSVIAR